MNTEEGNDVGNKDAQMTEPVAIWKHSSDTTEILARRNLFIDIDTQNGGAYRGLVPPQPQYAAFEDSTPTGLRSVVVALATQWGNVAHTLNKLAEERATDAVLPYVLSVLKLSVDLLREVDRAVVRASESGPRPPLEQIDLIQATKTLNKHRCRLLDYLRRAPELRDATAGLLRGSAITLGNDCMAQAKAAIEESR